MALELFNGVERERSLEPLSGEEETGSALKCISSVAQAAGSFNIFVLTKIGMASISGYVACNAKRIKYKQQHQSYSYFCDLVGHTHSRAQMASKYRGKTVRVAFMLAKKVLL